MYSFSSRRWLVFQLVCLAGFSLDINTADTYSARPGHSEHQTGLTCDITQPVSGGNLTSAGFQNTEQYAWLQEHAQEFGFILRYPADKVAITGYVYEPWHYRYVGKDAAASIRAEGLTLDEYWGKYRAQ